MRPLHKLTQLSHLVYTIRCPVPMFKFLVFAAAMGSVSVSAFSSVANRAVNRASSVLKMNFEDAIGAQPPLGGILLPFAFMNTPSLNLFLFI